MIDYSNRLIGYNLRNT